LLALVLDKIKPKIPVQTQFLLDQFSLSSFLLKVGTLVVLTRRALVGLPLGLLVGILELVTVVAWSA
jgi:hypothetical protein